MLGVRWITPPRPSLAPPCAKPSVSRRSLSGVNISALLYTPICKIYLPASPVFTLSVRRSGLYLFARKKHRNGSEVVLESRDSNNDFEHEDVNVDGGDDLDVIAPFEELDGWLQRTPRGFGEGKVYDTSIEDELLEEIEQSRRAQLANINKLKSLSLEPQKQPLDRDAEPISTGAIVRISHLPKKRNIHRDFKTAFKGTSGIVNIMPVVFGNKKTKDPICKGLAFVNFKSVEHAKRFTDIFSTQTITFGKINKRIKCEIVDRADDYTPHKSIKSKPDESSRLFLLDAEESSGDKDDDGIRESFKPLSASELDDDIDGIEQKLKCSVALLQSESEDNPRAAVKVKSNQNKREIKNTMAKIPGAAKRLKLREKATLAGVFSRYGRASASKES